MVAQLKEDMKEMGVTVGKVVLKQAALVVEVNTLQREKDALVETVAKMGSDHVAAIKAAKDDLQKQIDALTKVCVRGRGGWWGWWWLGGARG